MPEWPAPPNRRRAPDFSCLSCHSPHAKGPDDLLAVPRETNQACAGCHVDLAANLEAHSHHPAGSSRALCFNCHMPNTIYGMLKASRSHELTSPHVAAQLETGRTNACNLCRLDRIDALLKRRDNRLMKLGE